MDSAVVDYQSFQVVSDGVHELLFSAPRSTLQAIITAEATRGLSAGKRATQIAPLDRPGFESAE
jgi:hypothetical protein